jgi:glycosyltransferase involved in cell wall biosynthesis
MDHDVTFVVAGRLDARTGGSVYNRRIVETLCTQGWSADVRELPGAFPRPDDEAVEFAAGVFSDIPSGRVVVVDGLAGSALPGVLELHAARLRLVMLVHLPIAADVGLDTVTAARFRQSESRSLASAALVLVTGAATLPLLAGYEVAADRVALVEPGTDAAPAARGTPDGAVHLLSVAALNPGKGHDVLLQALARVPAANWQLTCAGSIARDPTTAARLQALTQSLGLRDRVRFTGELNGEALDRAYDAADVFVLATRQETYGMAVAEALARCLPVVSTTTGAIPALVGDEAGLLVAPGEVEARAQALTRVIGDEALRRRLTAGAARARNRLPSWDEAARRFGAALEGLSR